VIYLTGAYARTCRDVFVTAALIELKLILTDLNGVLDFPSLAPSCAKKRRQMGDGPVGLTNQYAYGKF